MTRRESDEAEKTRMLLNRLCHATLAPDLGPGRNRIGTRIADAVGRPDGMHMAAHAPLQLPVP
jgi:hypothetical protein